MLPQSHIAYTLAIYKWAQKRYPELPDVDQRLLALAATGPDLIDKPLAALYFYRRYKSAVLFAHTLIVHAALLIYTVVKRPHWWPYSLAFILHAVLDRMWFFPETFFWPFRGWHFTEWRKSGSEQEEISKAYWHAFTRRPELWIWELGGLMAGAWYFYTNKLYHPKNLVGLLRTGRLNKITDD